MSIEPEGAHHSGWFFGFACAFLLIKYRWLCVLFYLFFALPLAVLFFRHGLIGWFFTDVVWQLVKAVVSLPFYLFLAAFWP